MKSTEPKQFVKRPVKTTQPVDQTRKDFQKDKRVARDELRELALREAEA